MSFTRFSRHADVELQSGDVLDFPLAADSMIACRHHPSWAVARVFEGPDRRTYVRLIAVSDTTITKVVLAATLRAERFVRRERKAAPHAPS